ncbi:PspC domain-containing protein [Nocardioides sp. YR527]|uniref:PspC domain-containing protein n=1 Tax=Nocardioides sp. YR527 TaxID=1881028 RepID=UPI0015A12A08|nr:PspC domain-containing protein [Nocardioides sp. YR527]
MTIPPEAPLPPTPEPPSPVSEKRTRPSGEQLRNLSGLRRTTHASPEGRHIAGVAGGIARHFDVDPLLVRVMLVVAVFFGGAGGIVYVAAWVLVPEDGAEDGMIPVGPPARNLLLWIAGGIAAISLLGDAFGDTSIPWFWLAVLGVVALWYANRGKWGRKRGGPPPPPAASAATTGLDVPAAQTRVLPAPWPPGSYDPNTPLVRTGRRRPPLLFGRAIAVAALVVGVLGLVDVADWAPVPTSAYPAALLAVFGGFLVLGAFWGRAGGLIFLGLMALVALPLTMIDPSNFETGSSIEAHPRTVAALESSYVVDAGSIVLDMSAIDPKTLEGRDLDITSTFGEITVIVPDDATVSVEATMGTLGEAKVFDETRSDVGGFVVTRSHVAGEEGSEPGLAEDADLRLTATAELGAINVYEESDPRAVRFVDTPERSIR